MCLAQGPQPNDAGEAQARSLVVSSQAFFHWATVHPNCIFKIGHTCGLILNLFLTSVC